ncbi:hypothetical protein NQ317_004839 [Molorchus minor]|uniref:Optineurin n=1 Tax=Molorchus minor TaxID=1323400 RepID=A0ABQ9J3S8_9CUCU|nr:hypothetical protein NQ317_004839 [Molorchus minor]
MHTRGDISTMTAHSSYSDGFKMPTEPCPLPSLGSDEESFVVLWKDMDNKSLSVDPYEPIGASVLNEAKELISKELSLIQRAETSEHLQNASHQVSSGPKQTTSEIEKSASENMVQSTELPRMPQMERDFSPSDLISIATFSTDLTSEEVQKKVSQIIEENVHLKDTILQNNMSMKAQYERIVTWQEDVQKVHQAHKEKILEAKEFIERLKRENFSLSRDLEKLNEINKLQENELISLKQSLQEKQQQVNEKLVKSADNNMKEFELDIANKKVKELELEVENMTLENAHLRKDKIKLLDGFSKKDDYEKEIEKLQEQLHRSKIQIEEANMGLLKVTSLEEEKRQSLYKTVEALRSQISSTKQHAVPLEELENMRQQLTNTQIRLTEVELSRVQAYSHIENLSKEISELRRQLGDGQNISKDEIYALQAQLDVYRADFEAERTVKETIKTENDKYSEDIQNLQRRNQQLQEEIEMLREHRDYVVYPSRRRDHSSPSSASSNEHTMKCPKCNFGFTTQQALENHVYRCLEIDDNLP